MQAIFILLALGLAIGGIIGVVAANPFAVSILLVLSLPFAFLFDLRRRT